MHCSLIQEIRVRSNKIAPPSHQLFQLLVLTKVRRLISSSASQEDPVNKHNEKRLFKIHLSHWLVANEIIRSDY
uniref:Uncharacterized protein n=1 Tax=Arundo donax TaxID=35708 RepID=A0A0A9DZD4_ARUDO